MAVTTLGPKTALVISDLPKGIASLPTVHPIKEVAENAGKLADAFRAKHLPVVLVNVMGGAPGRSENTMQRGEMPSDWAQLIPELHEQPTDLKVTKKTWGAFQNTTLDEQLKKLEVTQIILAGVATSIGVESTARYAYEYGYNVTLATDAMTDMSAQAHENSIKRIFPRLGETGTTQEIISLLDQLSG
ncbi:MAG: isochorismatase family protein [Rhabdochlamydiaceae bacterium]